jgi:TRAP-type C4-dicarboxylate transport system permease small subunit
MKAFWAFFDNLERKMRMLGAFCLMCMVVVTCCDVIGRIFSYPIFGSEEIVHFLLTLVIGFSLPFSHLEKIHVGVEIVYRLLSAKIRLFLKLGTDILSLALMSTITVMMFDYFATTKETGEVSMNLEFPEYLVIFALGFCFLILNFFILRDILILANIKKSIVTFENEKGDA